MAKYFLAGILVILTFQVSATELCNLGELELEEEQEWLARLDSEFINEINDIKEVESLNKIPSLVFSVNDRIGNSVQWSKLMHALKNKPGHVLSGQRQSQFQQILERSTIKQVLSTSAMAASTVVDIALIVPWFEQVTRVMWDDSASSLHRLSVVFQPIPFIGFALSYYDYLSMLETPETRLRSFIQSGHYSYRQDTIAQQINLASAEDITHQYHRLKVHTNELVKRLVSVHLLHYDATFSAKVLEVQGLLSKSFATLDSDYTSLMLKRYNQAPQVDYPFGDEMCSEEKHQAKLEIDRQGTVSRNTRNLLRSCSYHRLVGNIDKLYGIGRYAHIEKVRNEAYVRKRVIVDGALDHIRLWRDTLLNKQKKAIEQAVAVVINNDEIINYHEMLIQKARTIAINNFAMVAVGRPATQEELASGRFLVGQGELVCGIYSCRRYQGREVLFEEAADPLLSQLKTLLIDIDVNQYIDVHLSKGWTNSELDAPYINLWEQWKHKQNQSFSSLPYRGNPSMEVIQRDMPALVEVLEKIPVELNEENAKPLLYQLINHELFREGAQYAWSIMGDFVFRFQYEQRQHQSINFLPKRWQREAWPSQPSSVLFNAFLDKSMLYYSGLQWREALPHIDSKITTDWFLYQGEGQKYYLTEQVDEDVYLSDSFWSERSQQLGYVLSLPQVRWRPFEYLILLDIWSQVVEIESIVKLKV
jgi:hypothetical protein